MEVLTKKDRLQIPQQKMKEQDPKERIRNVKEVPFGYDEESAKAEAARCLQCGPNAPCTKGCPVNINISEVMKATAEGDFRKAISIVKENNLLPGICGRVCPQEEQCQKNCTVGKVHKDPCKSVSIGNVERFLADWERNNTSSDEAKPSESTGFKVSVVGSGPAGLTVAGELARKGHEVHVFEALHGPGGVLAYGIPEFRLPKEIVKREVENLQKMGVEFHYNFVIGRTITMDEMRKDFDAIFVGTGAGLPRFMKIPGENLLGVYSANEYLTRCNLMKAYRFPENDTPILKAKKVAVVGGGNVAMDSARTALRLGAEKVMMIYRRGKDEMPARGEEIHHAGEEGVEFHTLENPVRIVGDENGWVKGVEVIKMELGEPDASGRRRPSAVEGSEYIKEADAVIIAIGNSPNPLIPQSCPELETEKWGGIITEEESMKTSVKGIFAGGDIVLGAATVIKAMEHGKKAAASIHEYLCGK